MLSVSSTGCNNERQSFAKLSYSAINNVLTNLLPAGLQDVLSGAQRLECDDDGTSKTNCWAAPQIEQSTGLKSGYLAASFLVLQILSHEDAKNAIVCRER